MVIRTDLSDGWVLRPADPVPITIGEAGVAATVPGCVHTDLLAAGLIPDPYLDDNEATLAWIGRTAWVYERVLDHTAVDGEQALLRFEGLDTIATISLSGDVVARTENMHRRYEIPVDLRDGRNLLSVRFDPAETFAEAERERLGALPNQYPAPFNYVRKMACNFGWDWGPALVTAGIWRPVSLVRHRRSRLVSVEPRVTVDGAQGTVAFDVTASGDDLLVEAAVGSTSVNQPASGEKTTVTVHIDHPERWWPHGLGAQPLYDVWVRLRQRGKVVDEWHDRIGFRTVRLDTTPDADGTPFLLLVNDVPMPVRGANWIPDDCFPSRITPARLRQRIGQAVDANVNLLRVWGGGIYESREFYRTCDERGVLVWQDFLFACAAYPEDERLAREVEAEARDNVARLMPHPSLVLWNGNNENLWGFVDWDWRSTIDGRPWGLGYYLDLLPRVVGDARPYWPGSPYSGTMDLHPNHDDHGTSHVWDVWNGKDYPAYRDRRPRFVAEFGWQAPPTWSTLTRAVHDVPLTPTSPGLRRHQKAHDGDGKLTRGLAPHLPTPASFVDWHFAMQLNQARAVRVGVEHFRSLRPRCSGTIMWQLNDCWPVTSWSAVDGDGRRKPLWYALRAAYAPRLLTIQPRGGNLTLYGLNDTMDGWLAPLTVRRLGFDGEELGSEHLDLSVDPLGVSSVELPVGLTRSDPGTVLVASTPWGRALWFFAEDRDLPYRPATMDLSVDRDGDDVLLTVSADTLVRDLCLFPDRVDPAAEADDALVTLLPGERRVLRVRGLPRGREAELLAPPVLRSANDLVPVGVP